MRLSSCRWLLFILALSACHEAPPAVPGVKIGRPYVIDGKTYYPEYDPTYDKIGLASWYGPGFHGKYTASGEVFNQNDLTAAHPTLPMPSLVRVTNLETGKSLIVRVNDRGPFKSNRIIDLSKKAAQELGIRSTARVRVQFLKKESENYIASLSGNTTKPAAMLAVNDNAEKAKDTSVMQSTEPQIAESRDATPGAGQMVTEVAPITTVSESDLTQPKKFALVKDAAAEPAPVAVADSHEVVAASEATSHGGWLIQAGSFAAEENAHKLDSQLAGIAALTIDKIEMNGKTWWRVRLGPFVDKVAADEALTRVRAAGLPDARVIVQ